MTLDYAVIFLYLGGMVAIGWWGRHRAGSAGDFLVAGRRLGPRMFSGTMAAVAVGGGSTIGGIGLGYTHGLSGAWMVVSIGLGLLILALFFSAGLVRLRVYTVAQMLGLRYGDSATRISALVMWMCSLMVAVTSAIAYATILGALFDMPRAAAVLLGGAVVACYCVLGGMWSISATDIVQFAVKTVGILLVLLPIALTAVGGVGGLRTRLPAGHLSPTDIGLPSILAYVVTYALGGLIGQDVWQRVFTARDDRTARLGGSLAGLYCLVYAVAGAVIGMAAKVLYPHLEHPDDAFATIVRDLLPAGVRGLVLAAALSAVMSTSSAALIACATLVRTDIWRRQPGRRDADTQYEGGDGDLRRVRVLVIVTQGVVVGVALVVNDVLHALTVAYNLLVAGLLVPIVVGWVWKRGTAAGALAAILVGSLSVTTHMAVRGIGATATIYYGLLASLAAYVLVSLITDPVAPEWIAAWQDRRAGRDPARCAKPQPHVHVPAFVDQAEEGPR